MSTSGRPHQELRPSQFITTYGPGSILETRSGPVVIKSIGDLFQSLQKDPQDFEILDPRLSASELSGGRIARLPSNEELGSSVDDPIYPTERFPFWSLCTQHQTEQYLYPAGNGCPNCPGMTRWDRTAKAGREAIRFVQACPDGHLDEVNWNRLVHQASGGCQPPYYAWRGGGRALRYVTINCPDCGAFENLGRAYGLPWRCTGRFPEIGPSSGATQCARPAKIIQRGAANLRMARVVTALTILDMPARSHHILSDRSILTTAATLKRHGLLDQATFFDDIRDTTPAASFDYLRQLPWDEVREALDSLLDNTTRPLKDDEFQRLVRAADHGAPPQPSQQPGVPPLFEVRRGDVRPMHGMNIPLRVAPVSRLRLVMVQSGYQRQDLQGSLVSVASSMAGGQSWYPGVELFGEGIFLDLADHPLILSGDRARAWEAFHQTAALPYEFPTHPVDVWWHTLSHRLLLGLSLNSGYSSASIRERVYFNFNAAGEPRGGLLLYTVQPGGDGTLGGLIALVEKFEDVIAAALANLDSCSNDPLCEESVREGAHGAACYSCLLASETSCEFLNHGLDRLLLLENHP